MPLVEHNDTGDFVSAPVLPKEPEAPPAWGQTFGAAFNLENDVLNAYEFMSRKNDYKPDANFRVMNRLRELDKENRTNLWDNYSDNFLGVRSEEEMNSVIGRINKEQKDKEVLERSGAAGVVASIAAGTLSPTILIPFIGPTVKGGKALAQAAALGAVAGAAQEIPLQAAQETRTVGESAFSIGASTVVSGLLGGAVGVLRAGEYDRLVKTLEDEVDMVRPPGGSPISNLSSGAVAQEAGRLKSPKTSAFLAWLGPVTRVLNQEDFSSHRWMMAQISDAGVRLEGNAYGVASNIGGTIEANVKTYAAMGAKAKDALDEGFNKLTFGEGNVPGFAPNIRAGLAGSFDSTKMGRQEFNEAVSRALRNGDKSEIPEVADAAGKIRRDLFDPILKAAQKAGIFGDVKVVGDESWLFRDFNRIAIERNPEEFISKIANSFAKNLYEDFGEKLTKLKESERRDSILIEDLVKPADVVKAEQEQLRAELKALDTGRGAQLVNAEDQIADLRRVARKAGEAGDKEARQIALQQARDLEASLGEELSSLRGERSERRRRLQGLARAAVLLEERQLKKLSQIEKIEDLNKKALERVARKGQKILNKLDEFTDKEMDAEISGFKNLFAELGARFDAGEERIVKLLEKESPENQQLLTAGISQEKTAGKLDDIAGEIEALENVDRFTLRRQIQSALDATIEKVLGLNERRVIRENKLIEAAAKLDPAQSARRIEDLKTRSKLRRTEFIERVSAKSGRAPDLDTGTVDFLPYARELAQQMKNNITGVGIRLPVHELIQGPRGSEIKRVLDISSNEVEAFIENDVEKLMLSYIRTLPPDIEIKKKFGDINGSQKLLEAQDELNNKIENLKKAYDEKVAKGERVNQKAFEKENARLSNEFKEQQSDIEATIGRLRGTWGLPDNPNGMAYRFFRTLNQINVLRLMGGTAISSIPDLARPIQRHGLMRTFRDGFIPLINDWKKVQMTAREAKLAGAGLDGYMFMQNQVLRDIMDDNGRYSKFERAIEHASKRMGAIALFEPWTTAMKRISAGVVIGKIGDSLDIVVGGAKATKKEIAEAQEFLNSKGFNPELAERVYAQLTSPNGGGRHNGVLMPNTEAWTDAKATQAFRSALVSEVDHTIITPGVERPLVMDSSTTGKVLFQFKSFGMSSTFKVLMAGLQQKDAAFLNGTIASLGMGALSYYLYGVAVGGETYDKMIKLDPAKFADEAIARSGILGIFSEGQRFLERVPATQKYVSFSGDRTTRRGGSDMADLLGGPSFGAFTSASKVLTSIDDPTQATLHQARTLLPFQNLSYLRRLLDEVEKSAGLPERRN